MAEAISLPKGYKRLGAFPLDEDSVFTTQAALDAYLAGGSSYAGQLVALVLDGENEVQVFKVNKDKTISVVGEFSLNIIYVDINASGVQDGSSWADAYVDIQSALSVAKPNQTIWVAKGVYKPTLSADRSISFNIKDGVKLYGGFEGGETDISIRNYVSNLTVLDGDIGSDEDNSDNTYTLIKSDNNKGFTLDGFTLRNANNTVVNASGGAFLLENLELCVINNCIIHDCFSPIAAGGQFYGGEYHFDNVEMYNLTSKYHAGLRVPEGVILLKNSTFRNIIATGGICSLSLGTAAGGGVSGWIDNCSFKNNTSAAYSDVYFYSGAGYGELVITNTLFKNLKSQYGVFMCNSNNSFNVYFLNNVFDSCEATHSSEGGCILWSKNHGSLTLANNTFKDNNVTNNIFLWGGTAPFFIYNNLFSGAVGSIFSQVNTLHVKNNKWQNVIVGNAPLVDENNIVGDSPKLDSRYFSKGDFTVIDKGNIAAWEEVVTLVSFLTGRIIKDFNDQNRILGDSIDIGAVENIVLVSSSNPKTYKPWDGLAKEIILSNEDTEKYKLNADVSSMELSFTIPIGSGVITKRIVIDNASTNTVPINTIVFLGTNWKFPVGVQPSGMPSNSIGILEAVVLGDNHVLLNWIIQE